MKGLFTVHLTTKPCITSWLSCVDSIDSLTYSHHPPISILVNLKTVYNVCTELMNVSFCCLVNTGVSTCSSPEKNIVYEFILISPAEPIMSCSSFLDGLWDGKQVAVQLLLCRALLEGFVENSMQQLCVVSKAFFM